MYISHVVIVLCMFYWNSCDVVFPLVVRAHARWYHSFDQLFHGSKLNT